MGSPTQQIVAHFLLCRLDQYLANPPNQTNLPLPTNLRSPGRPHRLAGHLPRGRQTLIGAGIPLHPHGGAGAWRRRGAEPARLHSGEICRLVLGLVRGQ